MNVLGIIAEYNPFHEGHKYHLQKSKELSGCDYTIAVMSGNFLQRGQPALYDKWLRAEIAVKNGIDLVIEIPTAFACNNSDYFSKGGISILEKLGCVKTISFGSENGNIEELRKVAGILASQSPEFNAEFKRNNKLGYSYPRSRMEALKYIVGEENSKVVNSPNNNLAIEYLRQIIELKSNLIPITIKRMGSDYNDIEFTGNIASATAIRDKLASTDYNVESVKSVIPKETYDTIKKNDKISKVNIENFYQMISYKIISSKLEEIMNIFSVSEGLENRIVESAMKASNMEELIASIKSKRFTQTRIQRTLMHLLLGLTKEKMSEYSYEGAIYARVLGLNSKGSEILKYIKKKECSKLPIITNINKELHRYPNITKILEYDIMASNIYNLGAGNDLIKNSDYKKKLYLGDHK
jgi:predicted nucleotidyltransferase